MACSSGGAQRPAGIRAPAALLAPRREAREERVDAMVCRFLEEIERRVLVCDGAMGTMLYAKGVFLNRSFDELNLSQPDLVSEVHQRYVAAGADVLETNTFGANRIKLSTFGLADRLHAINIEGVRIARRAARQQTYVAGSVGPLGIRVEPWGRAGVDEAETCFREQAGALVDGGVDLFLLETFRDLNEILAALRAIKSLCDLPVIAQMTTDADGNSLDGTPPEQFAPALERAGAHLIGVNCSVGPAPMLDTIERIIRVTHAKLSAQPNAGKPREVEGRNIYLCSPEYMASYARRFVGRGVRLVGGCCGTTPEHIRQISMALRSLTQAPPARAGVSGRPPSAASAPRAAAVPVAALVARSEKSRLADAIARGTFVVAVEMQPPRGLGCEEVLEQARRLKARGVEIVNVPDGPHGARMSALAVAVLIGQRAGVEPILHYACRDRVLLSMQSDLLGAHAMGVRNLLITTGEPRRTRDYPDVTTVLEVDSIGLTRAVAHLNQGLDIGGQPIGQPTVFHVGVAANPAALNLDEEVRRFQCKVEAGAEFAVTGPIFDVHDLEVFCRRIEAFRIPILAGLHPLGSLREAEFMANEVPGIRMPDALLDRMRRPETPSAALAEGVAIACEIAVQMKPMVQGVRILPAGDNLEAALRLIEAL